MIMSSLQAVSDDDKDDEPPAKVRVVEVLQQQLTGNLAGCAEHIGGLGWASFVVLGDMKVSGIVIISM